jgi:prepilin-type N-terminal cleavage/methylation domain-containing protein
MGKTMRPSLQRNRGFTLIELMVAVTLGLIILAALTSFFVRTSANRTELERNSRQIENGRYALSALRDDLTLAGFYADIVQPTTTVWNLPAACVTDPATVPTNWGFKPDALAPQLPAPLFVYADGAGRPVGCTPDYVANTDVVVVRRLNTEPVTWRRWRLRRTRCSCRSRNARTTTRPRLTWSTWQELGELQAEEARLQDRLGRAPLPRAALLRPATTA